MAAELEETLVKSALDGDLNLVKDLVENEGVKVDCTDKAGMTPLQQAAYAGHTDLCSYLLSKGADVNWDQHEYKYTALMFAGLSGKEDCVQLLLDAGADPDVKNTVNRNAAEMAAFVSQHQVVGIINNFISSKELQKYTQKSGLEDRAKLLPELLKPFHDLVCDSNLHPIHILKKLNLTPELVDEGKYLRQILDKMSAERMNPHNTHEGISLKLHYLSELLGFVQQAGSVDKLIKKLSKGRDTDGFLDQVEELLRSTLKSFPRSDSTLLGILIQKLARVQIGNSPTAIEAFADSINGKRMRSLDDKECSLCDQKNSKTCQGCLKEFYCSKECQKLHRPTHKKYCHKDS